MSILLIPKRETEKANVITYTDDHIVTINQSYQVLVMNSLDNKRFIIAPITIGYTGILFTFANINIGRLTIQAPANISIGDSSLGGTIYCDDDYYAQLTIQLISISRFAVIGAYGTWIAT